MRAQLDRLDLTLPSLNFLIGISLFGKINDLLRIKCKLCLTSAKSVINSLATLAETLESVSRAHLLPKHKV